jgi:bacterioferritin
MQNGIDSRNTELRFDGEEMLPTGLANEEILREDAEQLQVFSEKEENMAFKDELVAMLNKALSLEHAARIQYLAHAELIDGPGAEKIVERLKEIASDEKKHEDVFRGLIGSYLGGVPTMKMSETHEASGEKGIFEVNLKDEKTAIDFYKQMYSKVVENKDQFPYEFETLEHGIRHVIVDEQEHVAELSLLLGK